MVFGQVYLPCTSRSKATSFESSPFLMRTVYSPFCSILTLTNVRMVTYLMHKRMKQNLNYFYLLLITCNWATNILITWILFFLILCWKSCLFNFKKVKWSSDGVNMWLIIEKNARSVTLTKSNKVDYNGGPFTCCFESVYWGLCLMFQLDH